MSRDKLHSEALPWGWEEAYLAWGGLYRYLQWTLEGHPVSP